MSTSPFIQVSRLFLSKTSHSYRGLVVQCAEEGVASRELERVCARWRYGRIVEERCPAKFAVDLILFHSCFANPSNTLGRDTLAVCAWQCSLGLFGLPAAFANRFEGVHRSFSREKLRAPSATVSWISATFTLESNLATFRSAWSDPETRPIMEWAMIAYKGILRKPGTRHFNERLHMPLRMTDKKFYAEFNRTGPKFTTCPLPRLAPPHTAVVAFPRGFFQE